MKKRSISLLIILTLVLSMLIAPATVSAASKTPISKARITLSCNSYKWDGSAKKPAVTIKYGGKKLKSGKDYKIIGYVNNVKPGSAYVSIQGIGKYNGYAKKSFKIAYTQYFVKAESYPGRDLFGKTKDSFNWSYDDKGVHNVKVTQSVYGIKNLSMVTKVGKPKIEYWSNGTVYVKTTYKLTLLKQLKYIGDYKIATMTCEYQIVNGKLTVLKKTMKWSLTEKW